VARLRDAFGYTIVEPAAGELASGQSGMGRLAELPAIVDAVVGAIGSRPVREADLTGRHIVVSAGGTREPIDPVRFIGNRSTGKMGVAIAEAALARGARVTLVAANLDVAPPSGASTVVVESAAEMRAALHKLTHADDGRAGFDALVMAAAVSDFRPSTTADRKLERGGSLTLELEATPDILAQIARIARGTDREGGVTYEPMSPSPFLVGFAAETGSLDRAADKL